MTTQLSDARAALTTARESEAEAQRVHHALSADLSAAQRAADEARRAGDIARLAELTAKIGAGRDITADAAEVLRAKSAAVRRAEEDVAAIEASAAALRTQVDALAAELAEPRNRYRRAIWTAESAVQQAQHGLEKAQRELADADAHLEALRSRLVVVAGD